MKIAGLAICLIISRFTFAQEQVSYANLSESEAAKIAVLTNSIAAKDKSEVGKIRMLLRRSHRKYLKRYKAYASIDNVFESGRFDCLSGTYFLSMALKNMGIKHRIIETNYHIFLIAETARGEALIESTDREHGVVTNSDLIQEKIRSYCSRSHSGSYLANVRIYDEVLPTQLSGLFYFNQAVESFHRKDLVASSENLKKAWMIYDNPRVDEFMPILIESIRQSKLDEDCKARLTAVLQS